MTMFAQFAKEKETDDTPVDVEIVDRDGEPYVRKQDSKPMVFKVVGEYSEQYKRSDRRITNRVLKQAKRNEEFDYDDAVETAVEKVSGGVVGWTLEVDGNDVPFTKENLAVFLATAEWNVKHLRTEIERHRRFFKRASAS